MFMANQHSSNSVIEYFFAASGNLLLAYAFNFGFAILYLIQCTLPVANVVVSEYKWNLPVVFGICKTGGLINLHALFPQRNSCCSFPHTNGLPFLVKSYMGFNNFCNSGQNMLRTFTIPAKHLHPFTIQ